MKLRSFLSALGAVVVVLLLISAGGFFWLFSQNPLSLLHSGQESSPAAAMFVPKQAPLMTSLLVNPDRLEAFRQVIARPEQRRRTRSELAQLKQSVLATTGLDYERDVQPWLGDEVTLAVTTLDIDRDTGNGQQPGYLLAVATKDPERSREFLQLFWQNRAIAGTDLVFEQYKGVKLIYGKAVSEQAVAPIPLASAVVGEQFVLFANDPKVLRDAITNVQAPGLNLSSAEFYQQSIATITQPRIGLTFLNLPRLSSWIATRSSRRPDLTEPAPKLPVQTLAIALELSRNGLSAETALRDPNISGSATPPLTKPVGALQHLPATIPLAVSGTNLDRVWTDLSNGLPSYGSLASLVEQSLSDLQKRWKLDLPQDVFRWVKGEYAIGLLPPAAPAKPAKQPSAEWIFVAERSDADAEQGIAHLDELAAQQGLSVGTLQLNDHPVSAWTRLTTGSFIRNPMQTLQAKVQGVHTTVGNYEIFATSIAAMDAALKAIDQSLLNGESFQQAIAPLLEPNNGYLYLDWTAGKTLLERQFPVLNVLELAGQPLFQHLRSLTFSSYGTQSGIQRGGVFIRLS